MSFVDLHPEALLEKEASGALDDQGQVQLERHRECCEACRFEQRVRKDFAKELADAEPSLELSGLSELLARAKVPPPSEGRQRLRKHLRASVAWLVAAAIVFGTGAGIGRRTTVSVSEPAPQLPAATTALTGIDPPARYDEAPLPVPSVHADTPGAAAPARTARKRSRTSSPHAPVVATAVATDVATMEASPASLFKKESNARRQGDYVQVFSFHRELEARFGLSMEAQVSRAVMGRELLDLGRAEDALTCFEDYLAFGSGDLGEEVMAGRATALERLERLDEARAAWRRLLVTYPTTSYASHATARLETSSEF